MASFDTSMEEDPYEVSENSCNSIANEINGFSVSSPHPAHDHHHQDENDLNRANMMSDSAHKPSKVAWSDVYHPKTSLEQELKVCFKDLYNSMRMVEGEFTSPESYNPTAPYLPFRRYLVDWMVSWSGKTQIKSRRRRCGGDGAK